MNFKTNISKRNTKENIIKNKVSKLLAVAMLSTMITSVVVYSANAESIDENNTENTTMYTLDWLNVRTEPSLNSNVIVSLKPSTKVTVKSNDGVWSVVTVNDNSITSDLINSETEYYLFSYYLSEDEYGYCSFIDKYVTGEYNPFDTESKNDSDTINISYNDYTDEHLYGSNNDLEEKTVYFESETEESSNVENNTGYISASQFRSDGVEYYNGYCFTWYSENVLPGGGLDIDGRYTDKDGWVRDGEGYICLAAREDMRYQIMDTPFGTGKVYDVCPEGNIDVYVGW